MNPRHSLKNKFFSVILIVLIFNIILLFALGSTFFDKLYTYDKINMLKKGVNEIKTPYLTDNKQSVFDNIINLESQNMTICIFAVNEPYFELEYYSRQQYDPSKPYGRDIILLIQNLYKQNVFNQITKDNNYYVSTDEKENADSNITILANLTDNNYILIQTPIQFIKDIADLAIKYTVYISIFTFAIGALLIYFIADKGTKPIREIQKVADKISNLDFSDRCNVVSSDEIGLLSDSINNMSNKLQDFVSQLMVANEKLKEDLTRQEKTDKMRKQFIANVSHDFKTPLTLIMSYSEALIDMKNMDDSVKDEYLNIIINESNKMSEFVQELLKLSQLESGIIKIDKSNFSINEIISDVINNNKIITSVNNLIIKKHISDNCIVYADYYRIEQVFQNLYENAIKYTPIGNLIKITSSNMGDKCLVKVYNTGSSISGEDLENIFVSFYRADKSRKNMGNYGLGLAIVKVIMDMHGENYGFYNKDDGVEFWFELESAKIEQEIELEV